MKLWNTSQATLRRAWDRLETLSQKRFYAFVIAGLAALDLFVGFIPTDAILISSVLLRKNRWFRTTLAVTLGSVFGAMALASLGRWVGLPLLLSWPPFADLHQSATWREAEHWISHWGSPGMAFVAVGPLPQQPAVLICGFSQMSIAAIGAAVFVGRITKYLFFAWAALRAPHLLERLKLPRRWS